MQLTEEQIAAVRAFQTGDPLRVIAYAGAGKTSTLWAMAKAIPGRSGLYLAFNKAIAAEASHKFSNTRVDCRTAHSLAWRYVAGEGYRPDKMTRRPDMRAVENVTVPDAAACVTPETTLDDIDDLRNWLRSRGARRAALATLRRWMQSDDVFIWEKYVPHTIADGLYRRGVAALAGNIWSEMIRQTSFVPLGHDGYLKLWALSSPQLLTDVVYADEAQDLNPVLIGVLLNQQRQIISVGDPHQQIYAWRGAVDALKILPGAELRLTQSFRFGGEIADTASQLLAAMGETTPLRGNGRPGYVGPDDGGEPDAILCRTNAGVFSAVAAHPGCSIAGGVTELQTLVQDVERLQTGREAVGVELSLFGSWQEVLDAVEADDAAGLAPIVRIVEREGARRLIAVLATVRDNGRPVVGTAHKTKGLEWPHVALADDFRTTNPSMEERRLFYVALTRAQYEVTVDQDILTEYLTQFESGERDD